MLDFFFFIFAIEKNKDEAGTEMEGFGRWNLVSDAVQEVMACIV